MRRVLMLTAVLGLACAAPPKGVGVTPSGPLELNSPWHLSEVKSEMDDSVTIIASNEATTEWSDWMRREHRANLILRCKENKTEAYINLGGPTDPELGNYGQATIRVRFDAGDAQKHVVDLSTDSEAVFLPKPITRIGEMVGKSKMVLEWTQFRGGTTTATFDLSGSEEPIGKVRAACGW